MTTQKQTDARSLVTEASGRLAGMEAGDARRIGYSCPYVPEELIAASGMMAVRLPARDGSCLPQPGDTTGLDGFITACMPDQAAGTGFNCPLIRLEVPYANRYRSDSGAYEGFRQSLAGLRRDLEGISGKRQGLRGLARLSAGIRSRLATLYRLAMRDNPPFYWGDVFTLHQAGLAVPRKVFGAELDAVVKSLSSLDSEVAPPDLRARIVLAGGSLGPAEGVFDVIEAARGLVAADLLCSGSMRLTKRETIFGLVENPLDSITEHYLYNAPCAFEQGSSHARLDRLVILTRQCRAHGLIYHASAGSSAEMADYELISDRLYREQSVPSLLVTPDDVKAGTLEKVSEFTSIIGGAL